LHVELTLPARGKQKSRKRKAALYDLANDIGEAKNVADKHPDIVKQLNKLADDARADLGDKGIKGANVRKPGHVANAKPLTSP